MDSGLIEAVHARFNGDALRPLGVAIAGLGRSGWNIHAKTLVQMPRVYRIAAAMDPDAERRAQAGEEFGCAVFDDYDAMLGADGVDAVIVASPSHLHVEHTLAALEAGKHVIVEKPFALGVDDAERMIEAAKARGLIIAPFQNRRYEPHYRKVAEIIASGALGEVLQIRMCWHRFGRRWDWQAMRKFGGGALFNNGTHLLDQAMALLGDAEPEIFLDTRRGLSIGDADEHMKLVLRAEGHPTIDIEYTNSCAYEQDRWHVMGTAGGLRGTTDELEWRTIDWATMPARELCDGPAESRRYPAEEIPWVTHRWAEPLNTRTTYGLLFLDFFDAVRRGKPLLVSPESALRYMSVLDRCRAQLAELA